jgi:hypothetical protein
MTIAIGFHYGTDGNCRTNAALHSMKIFSERPQRNFRPGPTVENQGAAVGHIRQFSTRRVHLADYSERTASIRWRSGADSNLATSISTFNSDLHYRPSPPIANHPTTQS